MYLRITNNYWAIDIEGDPIPSTRVWCACAVNIVTKQVVELVGEEKIKQWFLLRKSEGCKFIAHNMLGYDAPTLNRLLKIGLVITDLIDTMLMSMLYSPNLEGGHSLDAWGQRLRTPKSSHSDFSQYTPEMLKYCLQDTYICRLIFLELVRRMNAAGYTEKGLELEHRSWSLIQQQQRNGFAFNLQEAHILYAKLRQLQNDIQEQIYSIWPPELKAVATFKRPFKKNGEPSANFLRHSEEYEKVKVSDFGDEYVCFDYVSFNIGSPPQRVQKLLELGWKPRADELTPTGQPKPTHKGQLVASLREFVEDTGEDGPRLIAQWIEIAARANMVNTWIEACNEQTGCIHGRLWVANTLRYTHSEPNTANIPGVRLDKEGHPLKGIDGVYTYEARNLWTTRNLSNRVMVGVDAKGIQLRVLAHYLNNPQFTKEVVEGDPHSYNQEIGQFRTRSVAKTFIYAFLLGAGDERVGQIIGGSTAEGRKTKERFIKNFPGLEALLGDLEQQIRRTGRIRLCDGTPLIVTQPHTRLGYLLQGDESRIMKMAAVIADQQIRKNKLDVLKVGDIHDEWQNDVLKDHAEQFAFDVCPYAFTEAGKRFDYRVPIDCDAKIGLTWAETH